MKNKGTLIMMLIWTILALLSFSTAIFTPVLFCKIVNYTFGVVNLLVIGAFVVLSKDNIKKEE